MDNGKMTKNNKLEKKINNYKFDIPLDKVKNKVVFEIVIDEKVYDIAKENKEPIDIFVSIRSRTKLLKFDVQPKGG